MLNAGRAAILKSRWFDVPALPMHLDKHKNDQGEHVRNVSDSYYQNTGPYDRVFMAIENCRARFVV